MQEGKQREKSNMKNSRGQQLLDTFRVLPGDAYYMSFRSSQSQESNALNSARIGVETKKLWPFEDNCIKLCENFVAQSPFRSCEMSCEIHLCKLRYLLPTKLDFFLKIFCVNFYFLLVISQRYY